MKKLELKEINIKDRDGSKATYKDLIINCLNNPQKDGFTVQEMRDRLKIFDKLEKAKKTLELEDSEAVVLKSCIKSMKWAILHKDIVSFCEDVEGM